MAFKEQITQLSTSKTNHADNFNQIFNELHDNGKYLKKEIESNDLEISALQKGKVDGGTYQLDKQAQARKDSEQDSILTALKKDKLENTYFEEYKVQQTQKNTEQDKRMETIETDAQKETERINTKIDNKIGMNEVFDDTNFNFIENEVIQEKKYALKSFAIDKNRRILSMSIDTVSIDKYLYLLLDVSTFNGNARFTIDGTVNGAIDYSIFGGNYVVTRTGQHVLMQKTKGNTTTVQMYFSQSLVDGGTSCLFNSVSIIESDYLLSSEEIQHNFSAINNSPSIKELHTTDSTGKTSILKLASDEDHVEMSTGRTLREEYMGVLKTMGKEFVSPDGSSVEVNNGIEARIINAEIKGQTVKNEFYDSPYGYANILGDGTIPLRGAAFSIAFNTSNEKCKINALEPNTTYTAVLDVLSTNLTNGRIRLIVGSTNNYGNGGNKTGLIKIKFTTESITPTFIELRKEAEEDKSEGKDLLFKFGIYKGDFTTNCPISSVCFGLSSTQAIISNNGQQYHIYESTILGKTRILDTNGNEVPAGTAGAKLVSLEPTDSNLPKLGGLPSIDDELSLSSLLITKNIHIGKLVDVMTTWTKTVVGTNTTRWYCGLSPARSSSSTVQDLLADSIKVSQDIVNIDEISIGTYGNTSSIHIRVPNNLTTDTDVKNWIRTNYPNTEICYWTATPTTIQITPEQALAYNAYKKLILCKKVGDVSDTFEIREDGSGHLLGNITEWKFNSSNISGGSVKEIGGKKAVEFSLSNKPNNVTYNSQGSGIRAVFDKINCFGAWSGGLTAKPNEISHCEYQNISNGFIYVLPDDSTISTIGEFKEFFDSTYGEVKVKHTTNVSKIISIDKSIMPTILTNKTNIWEVGGAVAASSYKIVQPIDKNAEQDAEIQNLKGRLNTVMNVLYANPLLVDTYINQEVEESQKTIKERMM